VRECSQWARNSSPSIYSDVFHLNSCKSTRTHTRGEIRSTSSSRPTTAAANFSLLLKKVHEKGLKRMLTQSEKGKAAGALLNGMKNFTHTPGLRFIEIRESHNYHTKRERSYRELKS
jgi:hypothetical protein